MTVGNSVTVRILLTVTEMYGSQISIRLYDVTF
jgi:hypothetical protein